jgi:hypothetical protein
MADQSLTMSRNAYTSQRDAFDNWVATRTATTDPTQDPEVVSRTRALDALKASERTAQEQVEAMDATLITVNQALVANREADQARDAADGRYQRARFAQEMRCSAFARTHRSRCWCWPAVIARKRKTDYWPLWRGLSSSPRSRFLWSWCPTCPVMAATCYGVGVSWPVSSRACT